MAIPLALVSAARLAVSAGRLAYLASRFASDTEEAVKLFRKGAEQLGRRTVSGISVDVKVSPELQRVLAGISSRRTYNSIQRGAINAAGQAIARSARATTLFRSRSGQLKKSIRVRTKVRLGDAIDGYVIAGSRNTVYRKAAVAKPGNGGTRDAFYAAWVEFGTKPHLIRARAAEAKPLAFGGRFVAGPVRHPGARRTDFLFRSYRASAGALQPAMDAYVEQRLRKLEVSGR